MFNIKFPIGIIILLIITVIVNVFSTITIEYFGISYEIFRTYEVQCGNIYEVINTVDIADFTQEKRVNWKYCQQKAYIVLITSGISLIFLATVLIFLIYLYKKKPKQEDITDLLSILKRMNKK
ncbi:hypothetical protein OA090_00375 [Acidimicrobiaceae bacterium]|jgi:hypothetical protein|nr:hypothetical protein [Acidimicrobiaceae bacterium]|tara:strand:- start:302 stop:670 length:369 start_codon:yes stop_codon:yes gene_type:complete